MSAFAYIKPGVLSPLVRSYGWRIFGCEYGRRTLPDDAGVRGRGRDAGVHVGCAESAEWLALTDFSPADSDSQVYFECFGEPAPDQSLGFKRYGFYDDTSSRYPRITPQNYVFPRKACFMLPYQHFANELCSKSVFSCHTSHAINTFWCA